MFGYKPINSKVPRLKSFFPKQYKQNFEYKQLDKVVQKPAPKVTGPQTVAMPMRFTEKHLIESLNVHAIVPHKPVMFYSMLN